MTPKLDRGPSGRRDSSAAYDDGGVACDDDGVLIRRYYPWGSKRVPYSSISSVEPLPLSGIQAVRRWRIWGSGDFVHWWNLDLRRPRKATALVLKLEGRIRPTITPDDPESVQRIIKNHMNAGVVQID